MKRLLLSLAALGFAHLLWSARADSIPYPNVGTIAPQVLTYAATSGGINVFYFGSQASFTDTVEIVDVATSFDSGAILSNHSTALGQTLLVGTSAGQINAGDQLVFYINSPQGKFASVASLSADGVNHGYITTFSGGTINGVSIPSGIYVGLEDEANGQSDFNYNDDTFVFTGVNAIPASTPEPGTFALLGTGILSAAGLMRRKLRSRVARRSDW